MLGDRIKELRHHLRLKSKEFAKLLRISPAHVSEIESNKNSPSEMLILLICKTFNISEEWLLTGKGEMFNKSRGFEVHETSASYGLTDDERRIIELLRESPELKGLCLKLLGTRQSYKETLEKLKRLADPSIIESS